MSNQWLNKPEREQYEIENFLSTYGKFPNAPFFEIISKQETPDYLVKDSETGSIYGVELTSVYLDDRSVLDYHITDIKECVQIDDDEKLLAQYMQRLLSAIQTKVNKARDHYDISYPLILAIYINEYVSIHLDNDDLEKWVQLNSEIFEDISPFSEIVLWNLVDDGAFSIKP